MRTRAKGVLRAVALVASCIAPAALGAHGRGPRSCGTGCERPGIAGCGDRAAVLGDATGGCGRVLRGVRPDQPPSGPGDAPIADLPQLPVALPAGALPVSPGAAPAVPWLGGAEGTPPRSLPGALPPIHPRRPARMLPGLPSIPVVRPVPARAEAAVEVAEPRPVLPLAVLAVGGVLAVSAGAVRRRRGRNVIYPDQ